jgi:hypothetical protein
MTALSLPDLDSRFKDFTDFSPIEILACLNNDYDISDPFAARLISYSSKAIQRWHTLTSAAVTQNQHDIVEAAKLLLAFCSLIKEKHDDVPAWFESYPLDGILISRTDLFAVSINKADPSNFSALLYDAYGLVDSPRSLLASIVPQFADIYGTDAGLAGAWFSWSECVWLAELAGLHFVVDGTSKENACDNLVELILDVVPMIADDELAWNDDPDIFAKIKTLIDNEHDLRILLFGKKHFYKETTG